MLNVQDLETSYAGIRAVRGASLAVEEGEIVALIGPNGAGKSTLVNTVSGLLKPSRGQVRFAGTDITGQPAYRIARAGVLQVPEGRRILTALSVRENLELGRLAAGTRHGGGDPLEQVWAMFPVLCERAALPGGALSGGQQQMLAIGRALMGSPRILLLDEPSLGLAPVVVTQVFEVLRTLSSSGLTILLVEQNARLALAHSNRAYVMERGRVAHQGASAQLAQDPAVQAHYFGA